MTNPPMYGPAWETCERCGTTSSIVKEGKCADEERCLRFATLRAKKQFDEHLAEKLRQLDVPVVGPVDLGGVRNRRQKR